MNGRSGVPAVVPNSFHPATAATGVPSGYFAVEKKPTSAVFALSGAALTFRKYRLNFAPPLIAPAMRTVSTAPTDNLFDDLDGKIVEGIEALRQRIVQAIRFRYRTWFLDRQKGLDYSRLIGYRTTPELAAATISNAIREEGQAEVESVDNVQFGYNQTDRGFWYSCLVTTIYGPMRLEI